MDTFIVPLIFGLIVAVAVAASASSRRYEAQWKAAADRLQLGFQPGRLLTRPKISGTKGDLAVTVDVSSSSSGSSGSVRTRYRVKYPPLGIDLRMSRQTGLTKAAAMFGMNDIEIGDAEFDEAFSIRTSGPQQLVARLSPAVRSVLLNLLADYKSVKISDELVSYEKGGIDKETGTVVTTTQRLIEAARTLQGASAERTSPPAPSRPVREAIPPPPPVVRADPFDTRPELDPIPPRPAPEPKATKRSTAKPVGSQPVPSGIPAITVAESLFARKGLSFQIARIFEEQYQGKIIDWPGEIVDIDPGAGPGDPTRVTVQVAVVQHELFGSVEVLAEASISGRTHRGLTEGRTVNLRGNLSGIDAMSRRLYVEDARLT